MIERFSLRLLGLVFALLLTPVIGQAACSTYLGQVVINEYNYQNNYIELKVLTPSLTSGGANPFAGWKLDVWKQSGQTMKKEGAADVSSNYTDSSKNTCRASSNYTYVRIPFTSNDMSSDAIVVLWHESSGNKVVDLFRVGSSSLQGYPSSINSGYSNYQQCSTIESALPSSAYDAPLIGSSGRKDIARMPDGTGPWGISPGNGANSQETPCVTNNNLLLTTKTPSSSNVTVGASNTFTWTLTAKNNGSSGDMSNVTLSDTLPANMYLSACPSGAACGGTAGAYTSLSQNVGTLTPGTTSTITATAYVTAEGSYTNTVTATATEISPGSVSASGSVTATAPSGPDHYELSLNTSSVACLASTVTVTACADASSPCTNKSTAVSGQTATLATTGGTLGSTTVTFNASGVASTTLSYPTAANNTSVTITLSGEQNAGVNPRKCCPDGINCAAANSCSTTFNTAGFIFATSAGGASTTVATQTAGTASATHYLRAVKTNTSTQACESALSGAQSVNFAYECHNPSTCSASNLMAVSGTSIQRNDNGASLSYLPVSLTFDANGNAPFTFTFNDVGQTSLQASKAAGGSLLTALTGSSNAFVTKPAGFTLSDIKCSTYGSGTCAPALASPGNNPGASTASGPAFIQAGQNFSVTATAVTSGGSATPNYGKETAPEGVKLSATRILPASGGASPVLTNATAFGSFSSGAATGSTFKWSEVGIITLTPSVGDGDYLGVGEVTGTTSSNVGRFIANHLTTTVTPGCNAGSYTYSGQPFSTSVKAYANGGTSPLQNFDSTLGFAQAVTLSDASGATVGSLSSTSVPASSFSGGTAGQTTASYTYTNRNTAPTAITIRATDADLISSNGQSEGSTTIRSGRVRLLNGYGSEQLDLPMILRAEYWNGSGWVQNTLDNCTGDPSLGAANGVTLSRSSTLSCVLDNGSPGLSGIGCTTAGSTSPTDKRYREGTTMVTGPGSLQKGDFNLWLQKPTGAGSLTITADVPTWLEYPWTSSSVSDPSARATFGVYKSPYIYRRENY